MGEIIGTLDDDDLNLWVRYPNGEGGYYGSADLQLITSTTPVTIQPGTYTAVVHPDGSMTLTSAQEAAEKQEPKPGEVWRDEDGDLFLVTDSTDEDGDRLSCYLTGTPGEVGNLDEMDTYAYPSLAAAIAAGALS
ncbi:hypothetical protein DEIPH_ctg011orf0061 [Deinococcus phoenicis]|uniref:Uncharacterized protein n=1 Tax=Deinococcus phoenicis TaxID=1476583 RepID=A0A016QSS7_9DEIO|nr:hypothetical protein [Deinococcus phoenicis]EYB69093.1 hypothetical protein DEIPH_ctg011orf0061 [Deinococcus phoenicis]